MVRETVLNVNEGQYLHNVMGMHTVADSLRFL